MVEEREYRRLQEMNIQLTLTLTSMKKRTQELSKALAQNLSFNKKANENLKVQKETIHELEQKNNKINHVNVELDKKIIEYETQLFINKEQMLNSQFKLDDKEEQQKELAMRKDFEIENLKNQLDDYKLELEEAVLEVENIKSKIKDGFVKIYPQQDDKDVEIIMINQVIQTDDVYIMSSQDGTPQQLSPNSKHN